MNAMGKNLEIRYSDLIGVPYLSLDCWQLARKFYKQVLNVELNHYCLGTPDTREEMQSLIYSNRGDFQKVNTPMFGDLILLKLYGVESHIAVYLSRNLMLHTTKTTGSVVDRVDRWSRNIVGVYRLPKKEATL